MKKTIKKCAVFCASISISASVSFAQVKVEYDNLGIGAQPYPAAKLWLQHNGTNGNAFGLHSTVSSAGSSTYGAYFQNNLLDAGPYQGGTSYGVYLDNYTGRYGNGLYGVYTNNYASGYSSTTTGYYVNNVNNGSYGGSMYGFRAQNLNNSFTGSVCGVYIENERLITPNQGSSGNTYGIFTTNTASVWSTFGAYLSATALNNNGAYGVYSTVSGGSAANTYSGYFTGGKFVVLGGAVGIGKDPTAGTLDVAGTIYASGSITSSDERLKSNIKNVTTETEKLYKLQGKSYIKSLAPTFEIVHDTTQKVEDTPREVKDTTTFFEYGYLAQELKEVFPELVSQGSDGYYGVNYVALIPIIVEALKDQRKTMEAQQREIEALKKALAGTSLKSAEIDLNEATQEMYLSDIAKAETLKLYQNAPNPFNQRTTVKCFVPEQFQKVQLCVYNMQGVQVQCLTITERGAVSIEIEAGALSAGIYSYVLLADGVASETKQMILTK